MSTPITTGARTYACTCPSSLTRKSTLPAVARPCSWQPAVCCVLDTFGSHEVENRGNEQRVHLVLDTVGGERLWDMVAAASQGDTPPEPVFLEPGRLSGARLRVELHNYPLVMSP